MCGLNERGEVVGVSIMYHTVAFKDSDDPDSMQGLGMTLLIRTLLERPDMADQISGLELDVNDEDDSAQLSDDAEWPDISTCRQKLLRMGIRETILEGVFRASTRTPAKHYRKHCLGLILAVICTNLKSVDIAPSSNRGTLLASVDLCNDQMSQLHMLPASIEFSDNCGLDSIEHFTYRGQSGRPIPPTSFLDLGLALPSLRRLTMYDVLHWDDFMDLLDLDEIVRSTVERIEMLGCRAEALIPAYTDMGEPLGFLSLCPSLKKLYVVWTTAMGPATGWFWQDLADQIGVACEEICFDVTPLPVIHQWSDYDGETHGANINQFSASNNIAADEHYDTIEHACDDTQICRLGSIKHLRALQKLRLPKSACVGYGPDEAGDDGYLVDESNGVFQNFDDFLADSLPDDTSKLQLEIVCPTYLLSNEDQALLAYATCKEFKSVTIYNCSRTAWVSSLDRPVPDEAMTGL